MTRIIRVIRERFTVEDDGHGGCVAVETRAPEIAAVACDGARGAGWFESPARQAVEIIRRENLGWMADGGDWFGWAEPSTVDYATGEEMTVTAHFAGDWTDAERRAVIRMTEWLDRRDADRAREYAARAPRFYGDTGRD